jgi:hypothetical protein
MSHIFVQGYSSAPGRAVAQRGKANIIRLSGAKVLRQRRDDVAILQI